MIRGQTTFPHHKWLCHFHASESWSPWSPAPWHGGISLGTFGWIIQSSLAVMTWSLSRLRKALPKSCQAGVVPCKGLGMPWRRGGVDGSARPTAALSHFAAPDRRRLGETLASYRPTSARGPLTINESKPLLLPHVLLSKRKSWPQQVWCSTFQPRPHC